MEQSAATIDLAAFEKTVTAAKAGAPVVEKDAKPTPPSVEKPVSSTADHEATDEAPVENAPASIEDAQAKISALTKELGRRRGNAEKVGQLEQEIAHLKGQLDGITKIKATETAASRLEEAVKKLGDDDIGLKQDEWQAELAALRVRYDQAMELGDMAKAEQIGQHISHSKEVLKVLRAEEKNRGERQRTEKQTMEQEATTIRGEIESMYDSVLKACPDFKNEESDLWKAGDAEFKKRPVLMQRLGPLSQVVAAALAIVNNPSLVGAKDASAVRKETLDALDTGFKKALHKTPGNAAASRSAPSHDVSTGDGLAAFNRYVDSIKGG